jgi:hypothetical protein
VPQQSHRQHFAQIDIFVAIPFANPSRAINSSSSICSRRLFEFRFYVFGYWAYTLHSRSQFFLAHAEFVAPISQFIGLINVDAVPVWPSPVSLVIWHA